MNSKVLSVCMFALMVFVTMSLLANAPVAEARPGQSEVENMAEALRYLEEIDKYYSQMARPR